MTIKGLTREVERGFSRIGKLRKGAPKQGNKAGRDLKYFRFVSVYSDERGKQMEADFAEAYGDEPVALRVYLPYETPEENFPHYREEWGSGSIIRRCDGENLLLWRDQRNGKIALGPRTCPKAGDYCDECKAKQVGHLEVILPEMWARKHIGLVSVDTTSKNDLINLWKNLLNNYALARALGSPNGLQGIEFILRRAPHMISTPSGGGQRARRESWLLSLEMAPQWASLQLQAASMGAVAQLPSPMASQVVDAEYRNIDYLEPPDDDDEEVQPEVHPEDGRADGQPDLSWKSDAKKKHQITVVYKDMDLNEDDLETIFGVRKLGDVDLPYDDLIKAMTEYGMGKRLAEAEAQQQAEPEGQPEARGAEEEAALEDERPY